jgi:predicted transport protein
MIPGLIFNTQRYYISLRKKRNFAFIKLRKKKITMVVMMNYDNVTGRIKKHAVKTLSESVQNFYNGPCCAIIIENSNYLDEVIELLKDIKK